MHEPLLVWRELPGVRADAEHRLPRPGRLARLVRDASSRLAAGGGTAVSVSVPALVPVAGRLFASDPDCVPLLRNDARRAADRQLAVRAAPQSPLKRYFKSGSRSGRWR